MAKTCPTQENPHPLDHEGRMIRLEGVVEQIGVRLGRMETKIDAVETKIDRLYRWVVPLQITTILAIVGLVFKAFNG